jgi:ribonucleoside-diphosphate reductase alpha chain
MGPSLPISQEIHAAKYRSRNESFRDAMSRIANALQDGTDHFHAFRDILLDMRFLPGGRIQASAGATRATTAFNCYVSGTIPDSMQGIMNRAAEAAETMRMGGGIGYDFSTLRPRGELITSLESTASGPVSFMDVFDAVCGTICSAGHRRGAQMGAMRIDHPDIEEFILAKNGTGRLKNFNISVGVTDEFMQCLQADMGFDLRYNGKRYKTIKASMLWDLIMRATWDYADPGVLFLDNINNWNNLRYCETIAATNPCGEQPLPPYGACLLGSFNLTRYVSELDGKRYIDLAQLAKDIPHVVRAMDNVIDRTIYPLKEQEFEAKHKRRMGLGVTGAANAIEALGYPYGTDDFNRMLSLILEAIKIEAYKASIELAREKGAFPAFAGQYVESWFMQKLPFAVHTDIARYGIRNSHLLSIAPTGTISLCADNISSGIEPVFAHKSTREIIMPDGKRIEEFKDYGLSKFGVFGKTSALCSVDDHLNVLLTAQNHVDSAVSKTCNVGDEVTWDEFKAIYWKAWNGGAKGCTTFRAAGKLKGMMQAADYTPAPKAEPEGMACVYDIKTGRKTCDA